MKIVYVFILTNNNKQHKIITSKNLISIQTFIQLKNDYGFVINLFELNRLLS